MMRLHNLWLPLFCLALPAYLLAEDKAGEISKLQQDIEITRTKEQVIREKNAELQAKMKDLESRIMELRQTLIQEEGGSADH